MKAITKVSVIIPVFNVELYLSECLDSLLNQTLNNIEVICVDDGSTDKSLSILKSYAARDSRVKVFHQDNQGAGTARNLGLQVAKGEYLSFLDSDDFFDPKMLETCTKTMDADQSDVLVYSARQYNHATGVTSEMPWSLRLARCPEHSPFSPLEMANYIFNTFQNWPWNKLFRHSFIKEKALKFQEIPRTNDMAFVCLALALANKISVVKESFANYRVGTGTSLQQTNDKFPTSFWDAYKETKRRLVEAGIYSTYEQSFLNSTLGGTLYNLNSVKTTQAYRDILSLIKYHADDEFGFMNKPIDYYYDLNWMSEFCKIKGLVKRAESPVGTPKISVVIPSLNSRTYIRECIESVLEQTLGEIEVFCVDAGSTDGTLDILEEYATLDKRINIIHSDKKSYGYQMNLGIKAAKGEYLSIVESDDYIVPNAYEELYKIAKENDVEVLRADFHIFIGEKNNHKFAFRKIVTNNNYYNKILDPSEDIQIFNCQNVPWSGLYSVKFLKENNILLNETPGASYQDNGLWFQCFTQSHRIYFYNKSYYRLRRDNPESSIYSKNKVFCMCDEYDFIRQNLDKDTELKEKFASICAYKRFTNYIWTLERIAEEYKLDFLKKFADDFITLDAAGELDSALFRKDQWTRLHKIMKDPVDYYYGNSTLSYNFLRCCPPEYYPRIMRRWFNEQTKSVLDLENVKTFNEKIQWLKLYDNSALKTRLADKYRVRDWIKEKIGDQYLIPILGVWKKFDDIDFDALPEQFVLKSNHGSGWNIVVRDKQTLDLADAKAKFDLWMSKNFALCGGLELQYGDIEPRIVAEQYMAELDGDIFDYRFFCFNGEPKFVWVDVGSGTKNHKRSIFDLTWKLQDMRVNYPNIVPVPEKPENFEEMLRLARILCSDFALVRVDFYSIHGKTYFGEMTFTPQSGIGKWYPPNQNQVYGNLIHLPLDNKKALPEKSFAEKGVPSLPVAFARPKTDEEVKKDTDNRRKRELAQRNQELAQKNKELAQKNKELAQKNKEIKKLKEEDQKLKEQINVIKKSKAFKVGETLALPVRTLRKIIK